MGTTARAMAAALAFATLTGPMSAQALEESPPDPGERFFQRAATYVKARNYKKALLFFEKALPYRNDTSDIFYNLVVVAEAVKEPDKVHLYGSGFLFLEPDTDDAKAIEAKVKKAAAQLEKLKRAPVLVSFDVEPKGLQIQINYVPLTRSFQRPVALAPGTYVATAEKDLHHPYKHDFEVVGDEAITITGALERMIFKGFLKIATTPGDGVRVFIDDKPAGTTPLEPIELETRRYLLRFEADGYDRWVRYVDISKDETFEIKPVLERITP